MKKYFKLLKKVVGIASKLLKKIKKIEWMRKECSKALTELSIKKSKEVQKLL